MPGGFRADTAELRAMAERLRSAGSTLRDATSSPPAPPDTGRSSGETAAAISQLTRATAALAALVGDYAQRVDSSAAAYDRCDEAASARLGDAMSGTFRSVHVSSDQSAISP